MIVRLVLGVLLLVTAGLKLFDPSPDTFSALHLLSSPRWRLAAIEMEALLGLWLLAGSLPGLLWLAAMLFFSLLAGVSLYLGIEGQSSCGCFGAKLPVSPWYVLGLDVVSVTSLWLARPLDPVGIIAIFRHSLKYFASYLSVATTAYIVGLSVLAYFLLPQALAGLRGEAVSVEPPVTDIGSGFRGDVRYLQLQVVNHTARSIRIVGCLSGCSGVVILPVDLPKAVPPEGMVAVEIKVKVRGPLERFKQPFMLLTDDEMQPLALAEVTGQVSESLEEEGPSLPLEP